MTRPILLNGPLVIGSKGQAHAVLGARDRIAAARARLVKETRTVPLRPWARSGKA
jgi:hypothetical protein